MAGLKYAPEFRLFINGAQAPAAMRNSISSVSFETGLEGADRVEVTLVNDNLRWLDNALLKMDNQLSLQLGYAPEQLTQVFVGNIVAQSVSFPASGSPILTVSAQDGREKMQQGKHDRWFGLPISGFGNVPLAPDAGLPFLVAPEDGVFPVIQPVGAALSQVLGGIEAAATGGDPDEMQKLIRQQVSESNFDFLARIASENGWEVLIDHSEPMGGFKLVFMSPMDHLDPDVTLTYGESLIEFTPRISNVGQIVSVTAFIWISAIKTQFTVTLGWDWDRMSLTLSIGAGPGSQGGPSEFVIDRPLNLASAPRKLVGELIPRLNKRLTGSGSIVGDPARQGRNRAELAGSRGPVRRALPCHVSDPHD